MTYWERVSDLDLHDLDQVGVTLEKRSDGYFIAGIAEKSGKPTVAAVRVGDKFDSGRQRSAKQCNALGYICRVAWRTWQRSNARYRKRWSAVNPAGKGNCLLKSDE